MTETPFPGVFEGDLGGVGFGLGVSAPSFLRSDFFDLFNGDLGSLSMLG